MIFVELHITFNYAVTQRKESYCTGINTQNKNLTTIDRSTDTAFYSRLEWYVFPFASFESNTPFIQDSNFELQVTTVWDDVGCLYSNNR